MKRLLVLLLCLVLFTYCTGCGGVFVAAAWNGGGITQSANGLVVIVQFSSVSSSGGFIFVTFVTFDQNGTSASVPFCGDQRNQFPMDQNVTVNFNPGQPCNQIVSVTVSPH